MLSLSAAFAWKISNEPHLTGSSVFGNMGLRASVGETGNDGIGNYARISGLVQDICLMTLVVGSSPGSIGNDDLQWEDY